MLRYTLYEERTRSTRNLFYRQPFFWRGVGGGVGEFNDVICLTQEHQRDIKEVSLFHFETFMLKTFVLVQASVECCATPATSKTWVHWLKLRPKLLIEAHINVHMLPSASCAIKWGTKWGLGKLHALAPHSAAPPPRRQSSGWANRGC